MIEVIKEKITEDKLRSFLDNPFPEMVKFVIDAEKKIIALGGEMHADAEKVLLESGSKQADLWGANIYPNKGIKERYKYHSLINIRPAQGNRSLEVEDVAVRRKMKEVIDKLLP